MNTTRSWIWCLLAGCYLAACQSPPPAFEGDPLPEVVDYNYHIKPILSDRCYACHGPDDEKREASLRLDTEEGLFARLEGEQKRFAIVPKDLGDSEIHHRIRTEDPDEIMPPPESNLILSDREKALIEKWIEQGAEWKPHWSFIPPEKPPLPAVQQSTWPVNGIDHFVLSRLEGMGKTPNGPADKERLLRRVYLDLTGLPPSVEAIDAFLDDERPEAYEAVVDRLLADPAFGERLAMEWMDVARYADSHGMHADGWRMMWPWRDWVIQAFNDNMPYDQFIAWQLAGDMVPEASKEQILATAFHRNHQMTAEGGVVDEEFRLEYVFDRANTTATAFLGLTLECARCHDHKFDPVSQEEFYQVSAFFNNVKELGMTGDDGNFGPMLLMPDDSTEKVLALLKQDIRTQSQAVKVAEEKVNLTRDFLQSFSRQLPKDPAGPVLSLGAERLVKGKEEQWVDGKPQALAVGAVEQVTGPRGKALRFDHDYAYLHLKELGFYELTQPFSVSLWAKPETERETQTLLGTSGNKNNFWRGWDLYLEKDNRLSFRFIHCLPHNYLHVRTEASIPLHAWTQVGFAYDGSGSAQGVDLFINGEKVPVKRVFDQLYKSPLPVQGPNELPDKRPIRVAKSYRAFTGENGVYKGGIDEIRIYERCLSELEFHQLAGKPVPPPGADAASQALWKDHYLKTAAKDLTAPRSKLRALRTRALEIMNEVPEVMVMEEMPESRPTYVLSRGQYNLPEEEVTPGTPSSVLAFPKGLAPNRQGLAQWLLSPQNPLTSRVIVNRYWQLIFGRGFVNTPQDFGNQGDLPSHPYLLDYLAWQFVDSGWDLKALFKSIVMSNTYRQSSLVNEAAYQADPDNRLLARGPSYRMSAEMIRDNALAASGLLVKQVGGPSVKPYQPEGLWIDKGNFSYKLLRYEPDSGQALYRRSLYTFVKRTSPHPAMVAFDAPDRSNCIVKRDNTSTPLQALVLMNDPQFVEAARVMAQRLMQKGPTSIREKVQRGFRQSTGRTATDAELDIFEQMYQDYLGQYEVDTSSANALLAVGEYPLADALPAQALAAMTVVCNTLLNHDEAYTKR